MALRLRTSAIAALMMVASGSAIATEADYRCSNGTQLRAVFSPPDQAPGQVTLTIEGSPTPLVLPQTVSADGGRYEKDDVLFWIKGRQATLTRHGVSETCQAS